MDKSQRKKITGTVQRSYAVSLQVRKAAAGSETATVEGYASVTEQPYTMYDWLGPFTEVIRAGAFEKTLSENPQVQLLLNHRGLSMAYTRAGTLRLSEDDTGLHMSADVNASRGDVADMLAALEDGAVDEMSFAFRIVKGMWTPDFEQYDISEVDIHRGDVSVVNFGANDATTVAARALDVVEHLEGEDLRAAHARLTARLAEADTDPKPERGHLASLAAARLSLLG
ncbi:MAG: HK97 family phage prohead protease [Actinomycetes bacterium]